MFKILKKKQLAESIFLMDIEAQRVAKSAQPGQFIIVRVSEKGERIPLTIADYNVENNSVTIVTQTIGASTRKICALNEGDYLLDFVGPLGNPSELVEMNDDELSKLNIAFIGGGVGAAPVYPQAKYLYNRGFAADVIIGTKSKETLILEKELGAVSKNLYIATDDGSKGFHGLVTNLLSDLVNNQEKHYDLIITIGPMIMMKFVAMLTNTLNIKTIASLNTLMVDATGMCGACRVTIDGQTKFACVDGPEFDAHKINFDEAMRRQMMYKNIENQKLADFEGVNHKCKIENNK